MTRYMSAAATRQETGTFRKLVEHEITADEYVRDLDRRATELREEEKPSVDKPQGS
jgi:hypothetical protein